MKQNTNNIGKTNQKLSYENENTIPFNKVGHSRTGQGLKQETSNASSTHS